MTALLSHTNAIPDATLSMTTGSATNLDSLKSMQVPVPFATITGASFEIRGTFSARTVRVAAVIATDLQASASISIGLINGSTAVSSTVPFVVTNGTFTVSGNVYSVRVMQTVDNRSTILLTLPADVTATQMRVTVTGAASTTRIGSLWCAPAAAVPLSPGWSLAPEDFSLSSAVGPTRWLNRRARAMRFSGTAERVLEPAAIGADGLEPLFQRLGSSEPVLWLPRTSEAYQRLAVYGFMEPPGRVAHVRGPIYRAELDVVGVI